MKKTRFLSVLMAIVLMAFSPQKMWAAPAITVEVTTGSGTQQYSNIQTARSAALNAVKATIKLLADVDVYADNGGNSNPSLAFNRSGGSDITLDLNGHKLQSQGATVILISKANKLTIIDSSAGKTGTVETNKYYPLDVSGGSVTIYDGTFRMTGTYGMAMFAYDSATVLLYGGRFVATGSTPDNTYAVNISGSETALANGYAYYDNINREEIGLTKGTIKSKDGNPAQDISVKPTSVKATLTIGGETTDYYSVLTAFDAAVSSTSPAEMKLLVDADLYNIQGWTTSLSVNKSTCDMTLDLNGHKIFHNQGGDVITQRAGKLTIIDSSVGQTGTMETTDGSAFAISGGSVTVRGGTFKTDKGHALYVGNNATASLYGGRFVGTGSDPNTSYSVYTLGSSTALAEGYAYYDNFENEELVMITGSIKDKNGKYAQDVSVRPTSVKATLTIEGETTNYYAFITAFNAALNSTSPVELKLFADVDVYAILGQYKSLEFKNSTCDMTLDLNGYSIFQSHGQRVIYQTTGKLTIKDSSTGQTGTIKTTFSRALQSDAGSLTIYGGTFTGSDSAMSAYYNSKVLLYGGRFVATDSDARTYALLTYANKTSLAPGYSYYNGETGEELESTTGWIMDEFGNYAKDVIVKPSSVATAIDDEIAITKDSDGNNDWYDLQGRKVSIPVKGGIYINGNKKIAVR